MLSICPHIKLRGGISLIFTFLYKDTPYCQYLKLPAENIKEIKALEFFLKILNILTQAIFDKEMVSDDDDFLALKKINNRVIVTLYTMFKEKLWF